MSLADEIEKLQALREQGALTEQEFVQAKAALINGASTGTGSGKSSSQSRSHGSNSNSNSGSGSTRPGAHHTDHRDLSLRHDDKLGEAAKMGVVFYIIMSVVGLIIMLIFFLAFFLPQWNNFQTDFDEKWEQMSPGNYQPLEIGD